MSAAVQREAGLDSAYSSEKSLIYNINLLALCVKVLVHLVQHYIYWQRHHTNQCYENLPVSSQIVVSDESCAWERVWYDN
jgi:hypothetical protein